MSQPVAQFRLGRCITHRAVPAAVLGLLAAAGAHAAPLWVSDGVAPFQVGSPAAIGAERIQFRADASQADNPYLELAASGNLLQATRMHSERFPGGWHWSGAIDGDADQVVTLTWSEGRLAGRLQTTTGLWEVRPLVEGESLLVQMDTDAFPDELAPLQPDLPLAPYRPAEATLPAAENAWRLDVLVTYLPAVVSEAGSLANLRASVRNFVFGANVAARESGFNGRFHLVGLMQSAVTDDPDLGVILPRVRTDAATMAERNAVGADLVSLLVPAAGHPDGCGIGYVMQDPASPGFDAWAYQVSRYDCAKTYFSWAHEHGHNLGMGHNQEQTPSTFYPYAHGWGVGGVFRTILSYASACTPSCPRVGRFSTPHRNYSGHPAGVADLAENARVGNNTAMTAAAFRTGNVIFADGYDG